MRALEVWLGPINLHQQHVPAHSGQVFNEIADVQAKKSKG